MSERLTRFRRRPCPTCGVMMRCRPGYAEGVAMLTWHCFDHGYWTDEDGPALGPAGGEEKP